MKIKSKLLNVRSYAGLTYLIFGYFLTTSIADNVSPLFLLSKIQRNDL